MAEVAQLAWWQRGAIYQIYPRSFADSNGDGVGDLAGITSHLDHLERLRITAIWLSPINPSPMADFGYDVSDYCDVDPLFGTLADLDTLVAQCHARGIRVVLDWVLNHTSEAHPWFAASRSSRDDPKRDWYVWRDGTPDGGPPNNWQSRFAAVGKGWTYDDPTGQWYLHSFMAEQPDLNWDNPEVEAAMHDVARFWLDRGIDGFRLDAVHRIAKDPQLRDNVDGEPNRDDDWESMPLRLQRLRAVLDEYDDRMMVGELYVLDLRRFVTYLTGGDQLHLAHNFAFLELPWSARQYRESIEYFERLAGEHTWPAWFLANHDLPRVASRFDHDGLGAQRARAIGVLLYALRGTPFVYQGEELGLPDGVVPPERVVDVDGRDPQRAPLPWQPPSVASYAGFGEHEPWLPVLDDAETLAAARQDVDPDSTLNLYRRLGELRAATPALQGGAQRMIAGECDDVLAWVRQDATDTVVAVVNFSAVAVTVPLPDDHLPAHLLVSSDPSRTDIGAPLTLAPSEALLLRPTRAAR